MLIILTHTALITIFLSHVTLSGHRTEKTIQQARKQGYYVIMYYVGLNSKEESLARIENRVRKGGHDIPKNDVCGDFDNRFDSLKRIVPLCDEVIFYDNENGFIKVAEIKETNSIIQTVTDLNGLQNLKIN